METKRIGHDNPPTFPIVPDGVSPALEQESGLVYWMDRTIRELERAHHEFAPDAVHDLRVALRRCTSIADVYAVFDPHPSWKEMKKQGKELFKKLGDLRDNQVMVTWIARLAGEQDPVAVALENYLNEKEAPLRERAREAIRDFNHRKWAGWKERLSHRARQVTIEDLIFFHVALERWHEAFALHRQALRNRSQISLHRLRIGLKRFRYTVENLLPQRRELWGQDFKAIQDLLGEIHDLDVLWRTALAIGALKEPEIRAAWRSRIHEERQPRMRAYRSRAIGKTSVWKAWRAGLPVDDELNQAAEARIQAWASFRDPDFARTRRVARLALQLYDGLKGENVLFKADSPEARSILHAAAIMRNVGLSVQRKRHQIAGSRLISKMQLPMAYSALSLRLAALVVRYHRGAFPRLNHKDFALLKHDQVQMVVLIAAILRLANAFEVSYEGRIRRLEVKRTPESIVIFASGYVDDDPVSRKLAAARHPLEIACQAPVLIRSQEN
jgi:CHAD domain-containing protein